MSTQEQLSSRPELPTLQARIRKATTRLRTTHWELPSWGATPISWSSMSPRPTHKARPLLMLMSQRRLLAKHHAPLLKTWRRTVQRCVCSYSTATLLMQDADGVPAMCAKTYVSHTRCLTPDIVHEPPHAGLRALQGRKQLEQLVRRVQAQRDSMRWGAAGPPPLVVKAGLAGCAFLLLCLDSRRCRWIRLRSLLALCSVRFGPLSLVRPSLLHSLQCKQRQWTRWRH